MACQLGHRAAFSLFHFDKSRFIHNSASSSAKNISPGAPIIRFIKRRAIGRIIFIILFALGITIAMPTHLSLMRGLLAFNQPLLYFCATFSRLCAL